jgi:sec-independent protein translocase protein TatA
MVANIILFISGGEIFFIMFIVVMVFGADKIPDIARGLGKGMRQLKDATEDIKQEIQKSADKQGINTDFTKDIKNQIEKVKENVTDNINEVTGSIKRK